MAFNGTWEEYEEENYEEFLRAISLPEAAIKVAKVEKTFTHIEQNGKDFVIGCTTPTFSVSNSFTIGKEADINNGKGRMMKCSVRMEDGKIIISSGMFTETWEIQGDDLIQADIGSLGITAIELDKGELRTRTSTQFLLLGEPDGQAAGGDKLGSGDWIFNTIMEKDPRKLPNVTAQIVELQSRRVRELESVPKTQHPHSSASHYTFTPHLKSQPYPSAEK